MMRKAIAAGISCAFISSAGAATLAADALACEDIAALQFALEQKIASGGGAETLRQARLHAQFYEASAKAEGIKGNLAAYEGRGARVGAADQAAGTAAGKAAAFGRIVSQCAALPAQAVTVVERRPISGVARVNAAVNGTPAAVWVLGVSVTD